MFGVSYTTKVDKRMEFCLNILVNKYFLSHFDTKTSFIHLTKSRFNNLFIGIVLAKCLQIKYLSEFLNIKEFTLSIE